MGIRSVFDSVLGYFGYARASDARMVEWRHRGGLYTVNELLYSNRAYLAGAQGGALESILTTYFGKSAADCPSGTTLAGAYPLTGHFAPFKEIVDVYQNCVPGTWGAETRPADTIGTGATEKPVNPRLLPALDAVWRMSNLDTEKQKIQRWAANYGTVGMRVTARRGEPPGAGRVAVRVDHPERLYNFEEDAEGNVTAVCLKYNLPVNYGTLDSPDYDYPEVVEIITREEFSRTVGGRQQLVDAERTNDLGFCPYVVLRHKDNGTPYGDWAYKGIEGAVHAINWRITRQSGAIDRNERPKWFGAGGGDAPETMELGDTSMTYVKLDPDTPAPFLEAIVPDLRYGDIRQYWEALIELVRRYNPEININDVRLLAGVSGESLAQVLKATEQMVLMARPLYRHALKRAMQMAVSAGVATGLWDVGTGFGAEQAEAAYRQGLEDFDFAETAALPETPQQRLVKAQARTAEDAADFDLARKAMGAGADEQEALEVAGYSPAEAGTIVRRKREVDVEPAESM